MSINREWIKDIWYIYTMEYYSAIKNIEIMPPAATWMDLETVILSEVRQRQIYDTAYTESKKKWYKWKSEICSVTSDSLWPLRLQPIRLMCPDNSPGQNTGVGSYSLLHEMFTIQKSNPGLPHGRWILYHLIHQGRPTYLQSRLTDTENKFMVIRKKGRMGDKLGNWDWHIHTIMYKRDN